MCLIFGSEQNPRIFNIPYRAKVLGENAVASVESHFIMSIHENFAAREVVDIAEAFAKVEQAYLR